MTDRQWELYRLSLVERIPDSPYKSAVICGINSKLRVLDMQDSNAALMTAESTGATR